jgi:hypothetical protein
LFLLLAKNIDYVLFMQMVRGVGCKEVVVYYFSSVRGWQGDQQMGATGGKRVPIKTHKGIYQDVACCT